LPTTLQAKWHAFIENIGGGDVILDPAGSATIDGSAASLTIQTDEGLLLVFDGTNYWTMRGMGGTGGTGTASILVNNQTGTTYTYLASDLGKLVTHTNVASIAGTLPQATGSFGAGFSMWVENRGAGTLTITPTTSTIDGAATLVLPQHQGVLIASDGTNYYTLRGKGPVDRDYGSITVSSNGRVWTLNNTAVTPGTYGDGSNVAQFTVGADGRLTAAANVAISAGFGLTITNKSANYTFVLGDANNAFLHPASDANPRTWTIPANSSVAFPVGTTLTFINMTGSTNFLLIAITTDTLYLGGTSLTGTRSLQIGGVATALKISSTEWIINGSALG